MGMGTSFPLILHLCETLCVPSKKRADPGSPLPWVTQPRLGGSRPTERPTELGPTAAGSEWGSSSRRGRAVISLQYYEMSYGLNIEMHKQVSGVGRHLLHPTSLRAPAVGSGSCGAEQTPHQPKVPPVAPGKSASWSPQANKSSSFSISFSSSFFSSPLSSLFPNTEECFHPSPLPLLFQR